MEKEALLKLKKDICKKRPEFIRQEAHKKKKLEMKWRQPKGQHSKMRKRFLGHRKHPSPGYRVPKKVRGLTLAGLKPVNVSNVRDAERLDPTTEIAVVANVGEKKKIEILKKLLEKNAKILNVKSPQEHIKSIEEALAKRKEETKKKEEKKQKSKEESLKKAKEKTIEEKSAEEKAKEEKEEMKKVLEKKE